MRERSLGNKTNRPLPSQMLLGRMITYTDDLLGARPNDLFAQER
jgi:hypothetical protein